MVIRSYRESRNYRVSSQSAWLAALVAASALTLLPLMSMAQSVDGAAEDSAATPSTSLDEVASPSDGGWDRVEGAEPDPGEGQVLEVPQVVDPESATADASADESDPNQTAAADDSTDSGDLPQRVGSLDDYENQQAAMAASGFYGVPVPMGFGAPRLGVGVGRLPMPMNVGGRGIFPAGPMIVSPGGLSPILPTSPMLMAPRTSRVTPGAPLGWWTRGGHR